MEKLSTPSLSALGIKLQPIVLEGSTVLSRQLKTNKIREAVKISLKLNMMTISQFAEYKLFWQSHYLCILFFWLSNGVPNIFVNLIWVAYTVRISSRLLLPLWH